MASPDNGRIEILHRIGNTLVHSWCEEGLIVSRKNALYRIADLSRPRLELLGRIPWSPRQWPAHLRLADRLLKHSILQAYETRSGCWLVSNGHGFWRIDPDGSVAKVPRFSATRPMNRGICESSDGVTYVPDYVPNRERSEPVRIYASTDMTGFSPIWEFPPGDIRHVHALIPDPRTDRIWVLTGDYDRESRILYTDDGFGSLETFLAEGQQTRASDLLFRDGRIIWGMDSPLETPDRGVTQRGAALLMLRPCGRVLHGSSVPGEGPARGAGKWWKCAWHGSSFWVGPRRVSGVRRPRRRGWRGRRRSRRR